MSFNINKIEILFSHLWAYGPFYYVILGPISRAE